MESEEGGVSGRLSATTNNIKLTLNSTHSELQQTHYSGLHYGTGELRRIRRSGSQRQTLECSYRLNARININNPGIPTTSADLVTLPDCRAR